MLYGIKLPAVKKKSVIIPLKVIAERILNYVKFQVSALI